MNYLSDLIKPLTNLIDDLHTSEEEKQQLINKAMEIELQGSSLILDANSKLLKAQSKIIVAEANGENWLQRGWRPMTMIGFLSLAMFDSFGFLANPLSTEAWELLKIGLGGYVVGRSGEKIIKEYKK